VYPEPRVPGVTSTQNCDFASKGNCCGYIRKGTPSALETKGTTVKVIRYQHSSSLLSSRSADSRSCLTQPGKSSRRVQYVRDSLHCALILSSMLLVLLNLIVPQVFRTSALHMMAWERESTSFLGPKGKQVEGVLGMRSAWPYQPCGYDTRG
jgi:hypothetical protein